QQRATVRGEHRRPVDRPQAGAPAGALRPAGGLEGPHLTLGGRGDHQAVPFGEAALDPPVEAGAPADLRSGAGQLELSDVVVEVTVLPYRTHLELVPARRQVGHVHLPGPPMTRLAGLLQRR